MTDSTQKICLTIAGLDPSGGAGIVADIRTFHAFGCYAAAVVTSLTYQNTQGVFGSSDQSYGQVKGQIGPVFDDLDIVSVKTGMLPNAGVVDAVVGSLENARPKFVVVDPVVRSTSGFDLIDDDGLRAIISKLFPLADIVTPNLIEAERIAGFSIRSAEDLDKAGETILAMGPANVLIKGGHQFEKGGDISIARDTLFSKDGKVTFDSERVDSTSTHGTGCVLSSAIAANLALGNSLESSIRTAKDFVTRGIKHAPKIGAGNSPIDLFG